AGGQYVLCSLTSANKTVSAVKDSSGNWTCPSGTSVLSGFNTAQLPIYALSPSQPNLTYRVLTTRPNYSQKYSGVEVTGTKRMSHNWMLRANLTFNNYTE